MARRARRAVCRPIVLVGSVKRCMLHGSNPCLLLGSDMIRLPGLDTPSHMIENRYGGGLTDYFEGMPNA